MSPALGVLVSAALALGPAPARLPQRFEDLEALVSNLAAQENYQALADTGERGFERAELDPSQRRLLAFFAIRGLHGVFEDSGKVASLCRARRLLRRVERDPGLADDASTAARLAKKTAKLLAAGGGEKQCARAVPAARSPAPASRPTSHASQDAAAPLASAGPTTPGATADPPAAPGARDDLVAVRGRAVEHVSHDMSRETKSVARSEGPARAPVDGSTSSAPPRDEEERRATARMRGGIASLSVGAAAGAALGASLYYRGQANDRIAALAVGAVARGDATPEEYAEAQRLNQEHQRSTVAAWATGVVAAVGLVAGISLLFVGPRRTRTAAAPWAGPTGAGLTLRGHF